MVVRKKAKPEEAVFVKEQLLAAARYAGKRDLLAALLEDGKDYQLKAVDEKIQQYEKGLVK